jgi:hypothetical protein
LDKGEVSRSEAPTVKQIIHASGGRFIVCNSSPYIHVIDGKGGLIDHIHMPRYVKSDFTAICYSPRRVLLYALGEDGAVYIIKVVDGLSPVLEKKVVVSEGRNILGITVGEMEGVDLMGAWDDGGSLKLYRPEE